MKPPPGMIVVTIEATDLDGRIFRLRKMVTFDEARDNLHYFMAQMAQEWKHDFHGTK